MNPNFLKKVFYNRKSRRGFKVSKRPIRRNYFKNNLRRKITYNYNSRIQTYGPNSTVINLSGLINWDMTENHKNFTDIIAGVVNHSDEYKKFKSDFQFIKILGIGVTIYPNDSLDNVPTYIDLDWTGTQLEEDDIVGSDRAKIIYNDLKKQKTFYYRPPDVITEDKFNPRRFNLISNFEYSSVILSVVQDGGLLKGRIDMRVCFRGPITPLNQMMFKPHIQKGIETSSENGNSIRKIKDNKKNENKKTNLKNQDEKKFNVTNFSFLSGLIQQGAEASEIVNSKNFNKLNKSKKKLIKKMLRMKEQNKSVVDYIKKNKEKRRNKKKERKENEKNNKNKNKKNEKHEEEEKIINDNKIINDDSFSSASNEQSESKWMIDDINQNNNLKELIFLKNVYNNRINKNKDELNSAGKDSKRIIKNQIKNDTILLNAVSNRIKELNNNRESPKNEDASF